MLYLFNILQGQETAEESQISARISSLPDVPHTEESQMLSLLTQMCPHPEIAASWAAARGESRGYTAQKFSRIKHFPTNCGEERSHGFRLYWKSVPQREFLSDSLQAN